MADDFEVSVEFDLIELKDMLVKDPAFIRAVANAVRTDLTKDARRMGDLLGKWAQRPIPVAAQPQTPGTNRLS